MAMLNVPASATVSADPRLNGLDHLRAFAIAYVFLLHYGTLFPHPSWVASIGSFGATGVDLFFVLSGYLIGAQLLRYVARGQPVAIREFYVKRVLRIIPAYLFVLGLYFFVPGFREFDSIPPLWRFLTFTQNFGLDVRAEHAFSHAWSLCVEEHFYLVLPVLIKWAASKQLQRRTKWIILAIFLTGLALRSYSWLGPFSVERTYDAWMKWIYLPTYNRLDGLLVGVCLAATEIFAQRHWAWLTRRWPLLGLMGLLLLCGAYAMSKQPSSFLNSLCSFPIIALGYGSVTLAALSPACFLYRTRWLVTSAVADLSYAFYLVHKGVIHLSQTVVTGLGIRSDSESAFVAALTACLVAAWLIRIAIEHPFMKLRSAAIRPGEVLNSESPRIRR